MSKNILKEEKVNLKNKIEEDSTQDFNSKMTIFYSPKTGKIAHVPDGKQDMDYFAEDKDDFNYEFLVVEKDLYIKNNPEKFIVQDGEVRLKLNPELDKYSVAR